MRLIAIKYFNRLTALIIMYPSLALVSVFIKQSCRFDLLFSDLHPSVQSNDKSGSEGICTHFNSLLSYIHFQLNMEKPITSILYESTLCSNPAASHYIGVCLVNNNKLHFNALWSGCRCRIVTYCNIFTDIRINLNNIGSSFW